MTMSQIANVDRETFWANHSWVHFAELSDKEKHLVIVPVCGFADWGLGHPLDVEETVGLAVLKFAIEELKGRVLVRVLPPLRFSLGPYHNCFFSIDPETAYCFVEEVVYSVKLSGFRKVVLFNTSPWNEEITEKACARDLRINLGLQMFSINLSALGLDFHPERSTSRRVVQTLATFLLGREPNLADNFSKQIPSDGLAPSEVGAAPALTECDSLMEAGRVGPRILSESGQRLARLLCDVHDRESLPDGGRISFKENGFD